jgi:hypothetical protein
MSTDTVAAPDAADRLDPADGHVQAIEERPGRRQPDMVLDAARLWYNARLIDHHMVQAFEVLGAAEQHLAPAVDKKRRQVAAQRAQSPVLVKIVDGEQSIGAAHHSKAAVVGLHDEQLAF